MKHLSTGRLLTVRPFLRQGQLLLFSLLLAGWASAHARTVYYVAPNGSDANDGLSWQTARQSIQAAASDASPRTQIWVAAGIYRNTHAIIPAGVELYGGFAGGEKGFGQRSPTRNVTTLDGGGTGTVVYLSSGTPPQRVDGFVITHGETGIFIDHSDARITGNIVTDNSSPDVGGGIRSRLGSPRISGNVISHNSGAARSGIHTFSGFPHIEGNTIAHNEATAYAGMLIEGSPFSAVVAGNQVFQNTSSYTAGVAIYGDPSEPLSSHANVHDNTIQGNVGGQVASLAIWFTSGTVANNLVKGNTGGFVSGLLFDTDDLLVSGNTVIANDSPGVQTPNGIVYGPAVGVVNGGNITLLYNRIMGNRAVFSVEIGAVPVTSLEN